MFQEQIFEFLMNENRYIEKKWKWSLNSNNAKKM